MESAYASTGSMIHSSLHCAAPMHIPEPQISTNNMHAAMCPTIVLDLVVLAALEPP